MKVCTAKPTKHNAGHVAGSKFCWLCGAPLGDYPEPRCPNCKERVGNPDHFCPNCGTNVEEITGVK